MTKVCDGRRLVVELFIKGLVKVFVWLVIKEKVPEQEAVG